MSFLVGESAFGQSCSVCSSNCTSGATADANECSFAACEGSVTTGISAASLSNATASGDTAFAASCSTASGQASSAVAGGSASGSRAFAASNGNANGNQSTALSGASANGVFSIALGNKSTAYSDYSISIGRQVDVATNTDNSIVIGYGGTNILSNGIDNSIMLGMNSNVPTMFIEDAGGSTGAIGRVGIGTTAPDALLHVEAASAGTEEIARFSVGGVNNNDNYFQIKNESPDNNELGIMLKAKNKTHSDRPVLMIKAVAGATSTTSTTSIFQFDSRYSGTGTNSRALFSWTEDNNGNTKMLMDANGNVGIGTNVPSGKLDVNGGVFANLGTTGTAGNYLRLVGGEIVEYTSTLNHKRNVEDISFDKDAFLSLRPVDFIWKESYGGATDVGLIAEEVEQIMPNMVNYSYQHTYLDQTTGEMLRDSIGNPVLDSTEIQPWGVDYHKMSIYLLALAKEQDSLINNMRDRLNAVEAAVETCCTSEREFRIGSDENETTEQREGHLKVFPNPNEGNFIIDYSMADNKMGTLYLITGSGEKMILLSNVSSNGMENINITGPSGVYQVVLESKGGELLETVKVVVVH